MLLRTNLGHTLIISILSSPLVMSLSCVTTKSFLLTSLNRCYRSFVFLKTWSSERGHLGQLPLPCGYRLAKPFHSSYPKKEISRIFRNSHIHLYIKIPIRRLGHLHRFITVVCDQDVEWGWDKVTLTK